MRVSWKRSQVVKAYLSFKRHADISFLKDTSFFAFVLANQGYMEGIFTSSRDLPQNVPQ